MKMRTKGLVGGERAAGIVAFWKSRDAAPRSGWYRPTEDWITSRRIHLSWPDGGPTDLLDVIDMDLRR